MTITQTVVTSLLPSYHSRSVYLTALLFGTLSSPEKLVVMWVRRIFQRTKRDLVPKKDQTH